MRKSDSHQRRGYLVLALRTIARSYCARGKNRKPCTLYNVYTEVIMKKGDNKKQKNEDKYCLFLSWWMIARPGLGQKISLCILDSAAQFFFN